MSSSKLWTFRVLTLVGAGLLLVSWFMPWWKADIDALAGAAVMIRPWGLEHNLGPDMAKMIDKAAMPAFFAPFMWAFLVACVLLLLLSMIVKDKAVGFGKLKFSLPQLLVGLVGLAYVVALIIAVVYASMRTSQFWGVKLIGYTYIDLGEPAVTGVNAALEPGYLIGWIAGLFLIVIALLRNKIVGSKKT